MMKISDIKVTITEKDLFSIINDVFSDFVKVDGLSFEKVLIDKNIQVFGVYKNKITIPFSAAIALVGVENNRLSLEIERVSIKNHKVFGGLIRTVLKVVSGKVKELGIVFSGSRINIDFYKLCKVIPMVDFELKGLNIIPYGLEAELKDFNFDGSDMQEDGKEEKAESEAKKDKAVNPASKDDGSRSEEKSENVNEKEDGSKNASDSKDNTKNKNGIIGKEYTYRKFRAELENKLGGKYKKVYPYIVMIPDIIALLTRLYKDPRVTKETKANISIALGYVLFPIDIIPDSIPIIGKLDDVAVLFFVLQKIFCDIPKEVIVENWEGEGNIIEIISGAMNFFGDKFGTGEIKKVVDLVRISSVKVFKFFAD